MPWNLFTLSLQTFLISPQPISRPSKEPAAPALPRGFPWSGQGAQVVVLKVWVSACKPPVLARVSPPWDVRAPVPEPAGRTDASPPQAGSVVQEGEAPRSEGDPAHTFVKTWDLQWPLCRWVNSLTSFCFYFYFLAIPPPPSWRCTPLVDMLTDTENDKEIVGNHPWVSSPLVTSVYSLPVPFLSHPFFVYEIKERVLCSPRLLQLNPVPVGLCWDMKIL